MLAVMTSLQQPITGKVSTLLAGIQPIMNKLLTEISNSSTMNPSDLTVSTSSSSSSTSSSSDVVKVELNNSVAANFGMTSGISTPMTSSLNSSGVNTGINSGIGPGLVSVVSSSSTFSGPQSRLTVSMNPTMSSSMNLPGMNHPGMSSGVNSNMNSGMNIGMGSGMNFGMGPGVTSGLGMQPMGNQIPSLPSGNLAGMQHQTPDVYTSAGVGGAAGPPMMNQNAQAQQTQVVHYKLKFTFT